MQRMKIKTVFHYKTTRGNVKMYNNPNASTMMWFAANDVGKDEGSSAELKDVEIPYSLYITSTKTRKANKNARVFWM